MAKFNDSAKVEEVVWNMRQADLPRGENRAVLNRLYNGDPPFDEATAEENGVQINRNFLEGTNILHQARGQWNNAFLKPGDFFSVNLESGPAHKRREWSHIITRNLNRRLKRSAKYMSMLRSTGASVILHGIGPVNWPNRKSPVPTPIPVSSLLVPSETDIDFDNLGYFAIFREYTPAQLYDLTHGPKVDPGWDMEIVMKQLRRVAEDVRKQPNATAYQYMPERIEELIKQDGGYWGSDAVPTIDIWDFYFRENEDGTGWKRRIILDWGIGDGLTSPDLRQGGGFLYSSGERNYADQVSQILHCQFGDCSAVSPFKYHSVRSLGWMLWGVCDLQNRMRCRFSESVFEQLMWFFRTSNQNQFDRIKKANFTHMGVIPDGVAFVTADQRFKPDGALIDMAFSANRQIMAENASSFTQDFDSGKTDKPMTATETMARVNAVNALVSSMLTLSYTYQNFQDREVARRFCIKNSPDADVRAFRLACMKEGVPAEYLDSEMWEIEAERVLGGGNKTLAIAQANQLLAMRQFLGPEAQRQVDNIAIETFTDDAALAESLAPLGQQKFATRSVDNAQKLTDRLMLGLPVYPEKDAVYEEYIAVWLQDMATIIQRVQQTGLPKPEELVGLGNIAQHIGAYLQIMAQDPSAKQKVRDFSDALGQMQNLLKGFAQQLAEQAQAAQQQGNGGIDPEVAGKIQSQIILAQAKAKNTLDSHAQKAGQKQVAFEMDQARKDREQAAELRRKATETQADIALNSIREMNQPEPKPSNANP